MSSYNKPSDYDKDIKLVFDKAMGYYLFFDVNHPLAAKNGKVFYHRHVASVREGRWIDSEEHIHHKDEDKTNNGFDNLMILSSSEHSQLHKPKPPQKACGVCGTIFDPDKPWSKFCSPKCSQDNQSKNSIELVWNTYQTEGSYSAAGRKLGISDVAVKKRLKKAGYIK